MRENKSKSARRSQISSSVSKDKHELVSKFIRNKSNINSQMHVCLGSHEYFTGLCSAVFWMEGYSASPFLPSMVQFCHLLRLCWPLASVLEDSWVLPNGFGLGLLRSCQQLSQHFGFFHFLCWASLSIVFGFRYYSLSYIIVWIANKKKIFIFPGHCWCSLQIF